MAFPVIIGIIKIAGYAITAYEIYRVGANIYEEIDLQKKNMQNAKDKIKKIMESLDLEISDKIDKKTEKAQLELLTAQDKQSSTTKNATGRGTKPSNIQVAIKEKIPFRAVISKICEVADLLPMPQLRAKKGQKLSDVVTASKMQTMMTLLSMTSNEFFAAKVEDFTIVRLKQLATNIMLEFMDELLTWKSPLKAEVCFGYDGKKYLAPQLAGTTRLKRVGSEINPFWPMPYKGRGVIGADIIIPEYRGEPLTLTNIFALVEIKFQGDRIETDQFDNYEDLRKQCVQEKMVSKITGSEGFKLSLFRYPEDITLDNPKSQNTQQQNSKSGGKK